MKLLDLSMAGLSIIALSGCGGSSSTSGAAGSFKMTSLASASATSFSLKSQNQPVKIKAALDNTRLMPSETGYGFAVVDGVKYHMTKIKLEHAADQGVEIINMAKDVVFTDSSTQTLAINEAVTFPVGRYRGIALHFTNKWSIKGYCRTGYNGSSTSGNLVYTAAAGVKKVACSGDCSTLPTDYDFVDLDHMNTYHGYDDSNDYQQETHLDFTISAMDTPNLSILYDGSYSVACWDGDSWNSNHAFAGFSGIDTSVHERSYFFPDGSPAMSTWYLPVFGYVTNSSTEATPTARTFAATIGATQGSATSLLHLDTGASPKSLPIVTVVYKSDGTPIMGSTRNFQGIGSGSCTAPTTDGSNSNVFDLELSNFTTAASGAGHDFNSSGWYWNGSGIPEFVPNRKFASFDPPSTVGTVFSTVVTDGTGCGQPLSDFQGNNPSACCYGSGNSATLYWKELTR